MPLIERMSGEYGVGPVCRELDIAPSTYYWHRQRQQHPEHGSRRAKYDIQITQEIKRVYEENYVVYGGFVNGMVAPYILCHSGTINRHYLSGAAIMNVKTIGIDLAKEVFVRPASRLNFCFTGERTA